MRVLVCPLDWGLGHATRCVPIIRALRAARHEVVIAASGGGRRLLQGEFPDLEIEEFPSYAMRYSKHRFVLPLWILAQLPIFLASILQERSLVHRLVRRHRIDLVISDGRYGVRTRRVPSIFITHQLSILTPGPAWLRQLLHRPILLLNRMALKGFNEIWVPDFPGTVNLSGQLGHPNRIWPNVRYIRPLCRFRPESVEGRIETLALVSGPEPQRTLLEEMLLRALEKMSGTRVLLRGLPGRVVGAIHESPVRNGGHDAPQQIAIGNLTVFDHVPGHQLTQFLIAANRVVCRSGYTSVMELAGMGKRSVLMIPTPGQPEQEYLADHLHSMGFVESQAQEHLDLEGGLHRAATLPGFAELFMSAEVSSQPWDLAGWIQNHPRFRGGK